jgi:hypothetical protein
MRLTAPCVLASAFFTLTEVRNTRHISPLHSFKANTRLTKEKAGVLDRVGISRRSGFFNVTAPDAVIGVDKGGPDPETVTETVIHTVNIPTLPSGDIHAEQFEG